MSPERPGGVSAVGIRLLHAVKGVPCNFRKRASHGAIPVSYPVQPVVFAAQPHIEAYHHCQHDRHRQMCVIIRPPVVITARPDVAGCVRRYEDAINVRACTGTGDPVALMSL